MWIIREKYFSLLADQRMAILSIDNICLRREKFVTDLYVVYTGAPNTNSKAYKKAQKSLKELEEMTFFDDGIDALLLVELKRKL